MGAVTMYQRSAPPILSRPGLHRIIASFGRIGHDIRAWNCNSRFLPYNPRPFEQPGGELFWDCICGSSL